MVVVEGHGGDVYTGFSGFPLGIRFLPGLVEKKKTPIGSLLFLRRVQRAYHMPGRIQGDRSTWNTRRKKLGRKGDETVMEDLVVLHRRTSLAFYSGTTVTCG